MDEGMSVDAAPLTALLEALLIDDSALLAELDADELALLRPVAFTLHEPPTLDAAELTALDGDELPTLDAAELAALDAAELICRFLLLAANWLWSA